MDTGKPRHKQIDQPTCMRVLAQVTKSGLTWLFPTYLMVCPRRNDWKQYEWGPLSSSFSFANVKGCERLTERLHLLLESLNCSVQGIYFSFLCVENSEKAFPADRSLDKGICATMYVFTYVWAVCSILGFIFKPCASKLLCRNSLCSSPPALVPCQSSLIFFC